LSKRLIISFPAHPFMFWIYLFITIPLFLLAQEVLTKTFINLGFSRNIALFIAGNLFFLSLILSIFNLKVKEIGTRTYRVVFEKQYISFYGFPFPVIMPRFVENKIVIALNIGGCIIPIIMSSILLIGLRMYPATYIAVASGILVTCVVTYYSSRAIPGLGIAVPSLIPPLIASLSAIILVREIWLAIPVAYVSGSLGSLIGADVLRLKKDLYKFVNIYGPALLSIGGAGTFDGIYLSGILAVLLVYITL